MNEAFDSGVCLKSLSFLEAVALLSFKAEVRCEWNHVVEFLSPGDQEEGIKIPSHVVLMKFMVLCLYQ